MKPGVKKYVLDVDIADACDVLLIEQKAFDVTSSLAEQVFEIIQGEPGVKRCDTQVCSQLVFAKLLFKHQMHVAEPPYTNGEARSIFQIEFYMVLLRQLVIWFEVNEVNAHTWIEQKPVRV